MKLPAQIGSFRYVLTGSIRIDDFNKVVSNFERDMGDICIRRYRRISKFLSNRITFYTRKGYRGY